MKRCAECATPPACDYYEICLEGRIKEKPKPDPQHEERPPTYPGKKRVKR